MYHEFTEMQCLETDHCLAVGITLSGDQPRDALFSVLSRCLLEEGNGKSYIADLKFSIAALGDLVSIATSPYTLAIN